MPAYVIWAVAGLLLAFVELATGTFYVLMIAIGVFAGALADLLGADAPWQFLIAAAVALAAIVVLRKRGLGRFSRRLDSSVDPQQNLDIGGVVHVNDWRDGAARVQYRGTQWDAVLVAGADAHAGRFYIREVRGTCLTLSDAPA
jgi:membrane protein implicated in regulation of membrane protease activity